MNITHIANEINLTQEETLYFKYILENLSKEELDLSKTKEKTVYSLLDILIQRVEKKNIGKISEIIISSLKPSISLVKDEYLESFSIEIGDSPSLIFEEYIQDKMDNFIKQRVEIDKEIMSQKSADIARLVTLMSEYLGDAIDNNKKGSLNIGNIKNEINSMNIAGTTREELNNLQVKLVNAATTIENEIDHVNKKLKSGRDEVNALENKIRQLENDLKRSKEESSIDYLTKLLTRRAYEKEIEKFEENYLRKSEDYAIIFLDLDDFKKINDTYGHDCGDVVLETFAQILQKLTRKADILGRYGGEEFIVAIRYDNEDELSKYLLRVKSVVTTNKFIYKDLKLNISFSGGVDIRSNHKNYKDTLQQSDALLYQAKKNGKNRIILSSGITV